MLPRQTKQTRTTPDESAEGAMGPISHKIAGLKTHLRRFSLRRLWLASSSDPLVSF